PAKCCRAPVGARASLLAQDLWRQIVKVNRAQFYERPGKSRRQRFERIRSPNRRDCRSIQRFLRRRPDELRISRRHTSIAHDLELQLDPTLFTELYRFRHYRLPIPFHALLHSRKIISEVHALIRREHGHAAVGSAGLTAS